MLIFFYSTCFVAWSHVSLGRACDDTTVNAFQHNCRPWRKPRMDFSNQRSLVSYLTKPARDIHSQWAVNTSLRVSAFSSPALFKSVSEPSVMIVCNISGLVSHVSDGPSIFWPRFHNLIPLLCIMEPFSKQSRSIVNCNIVSIHSLDLTYSS